MRTVHHILQSKGTIVWSVSPGATVFEALSLMAEKNIGALPVVDDAALTGIFSERDYARKVALKGKSSKEVQVREVMTPGVFSVAPAASIEECMKIMTERHIRHLPVLRDGKLAGMISIGDVVKEIIADQRATIDQLSGYITGKA
ncbi:MAG TPA: CBS domain-containing protein [Bacteroidota bacterium]|nr:CBS domain-containing protein [Bacteroidota bacterium]